MRIKEIIAWDRLIQDTKKLHEAEKKLSYQLDSELIDITDTLKEFLHLYLISEIYFNPSFDMVELDDLEGDFPNPIQMRFFTCKCEPVYKKIR